MGRHRTRAAARPWSHHRPRYHRARTGVIVVRKGSAITARWNSSRNVPIAVTWHAGTFYAAIEALEAAGVPYSEIKLVHANDRLGALLNGETEAAALMEPLVGRAYAAKARASLPICVGAAASWSATRWTTTRLAASCARSTAPSRICARTRRVRGAELLRGFDAGAARDRIAARSDWGTALQARPSSTKRSIG